MSVVPPTVGAAEPAFPSDSATLGAPYFTWALIVLLLLIFGAELLLNFDPDGKSLGPTSRTLYYLGAISRPAVFDHGQWWRIFTAPLLHANFWHVFFNGLALLLIGRLLEPRIGWRWMAAVFAISAICGSLMSLAMDPVTQVGVGASGGIVGVFAAALGVASRLSPGRSRRSLLGWATLGLISSFVSLLPSLSSGGSRITIGFHFRVLGGGADYAVHFGGAIAGVLLSVLLRRLWPREARRPSGSWVAVMIAGAYFAIAALAVVPLWHPYSEVAMLVPHWPENPPELEGLTAQLARDYPRDPQVHYLEANGFLKQGKLAQAEGSLRLALTDADQLQDVISPAFEAEVKAILADTLHKEGKLDEAKVVAGPACNLVSAVLLVVLQSEGLCPAAAANVDSLLLNEVDVASPRTVPLLVDPIDPSRQLADALGKLRRGNIDEAETELQATYANINDGQDPAPPSVVAHNIQALLATATYVKGDTEMAKNLAAPVCAFETQGLYAKLLKDDKLC